MFDPVEWANDCRHGRFDSNGRPIPETDEGDELWEALYPAAERDSRGRPGRPHWDDFRLAQSEDASRGAHVRLDELDRVIEQYA